MRIMIIVPSLGRGGAERVAVDLAAAWQDTHEVILVAFWSVAQPLASPVEPVILESGPTSNPCLKLLSGCRRALALTALFRRHRPDGILAFTETANLPAVVAAALCGRTRRLTVSIHTDFRQHRWLTRRAMRWLYPRVRLVVNTRAGRDQLRSSSIARDRSIHVLPNPLPQPPPAEHASLNLPASYIAAAGRLAPEKDYPLLLRAYAWASERFCLPPLLIAGEGPERDALQDLVRALRLDGQVRFVGFLKDVRRFLRGASLLALTSRREGWSLVIAEALAEGCPVVSVDCEVGPREILADGRFGILVKERTAEAVGRALADTLGNEETLSRLRSLGPRRAADFSCEVIAPRWLEVVCAGAGCSPTNPGG